MTKPRYLCRYLAGVALPVLFGLLLCWVFRAEIATAMFRWLDVGEPPQKTDYAFVLHGDHETRPFVAAALWKKGYCDRIAFGTIDRQKGLQWNRPSESEICRNILLAQGVPEDCLLQLPGNVSNTQQEMQVLHRLLQSEPTATVTVVTNHFHTRRSRWVMTLIAPDAMQRVRMCSAPYGLYDEHNWWTTPDGFIEINLEFVKLAGYWLRYGNGLAVIGVGTTGLIVVFVVIRILLLRRARPTTTQGRKGIA